MKESNTYLNLKTLRLNMIIKIKNLKYKIRNCNNTDYKPIYNLFKKNMCALFLKHWGGWKPETFKKDFNKKNIKIIEHNKKIIAFYDLQFKTNCSYIHNIQIATAMQGKGLGSYLMKEMEERTKKQKLNKIRLRVFKDNPAKKLYLKQGYKQIKDEGSSVILEKKL